MDIVGKRVFSGLLAAARGRGGKWAFPVIALGALGAGCDLVAGLQHFELSGQGGSGTTNSGGQTTGGQTTGGQTTGGQNTGGPATGGGSTCAPVDDGKECTEDICQDGMPAHTNKPQGAPCTIGGSKCDGNGECVVCIAQADCGGGTTCEMGRCRCAGPLGFPGPRLSPVANPPAAMVVGDFQTAGSADIVVGSSQSMDTTLRLMFNQGSGLFTDSGLSLATGSPFTSVAVADFDTDGKLDIAGLSDNDHKVDILFRQPDDTFFLPGAYDANATARALAVGDFNGDTKIDIVVLDSGAVTLLSNIGNKSFQFKAVATVGTTPRSLSVGRFDGDAYDDVVVMNYGSQDYNVLLGNGSSSFNLLPTMSLPAGLGSPTAVATNDFNGDGKADIAVATTSASKNLAVLLGQGDGTFIDGSTLLVPGSVSNTNKGLVADDLNGDMHPDIAVLTGSQGLSVLLGQGDGTFAAPVVYTAGKSLAALSSGDFDHDGKRDLAVADLGSSGLNVLLGKGDGTFVTPVPYPLTATPTSLIAAPLLSEAKVDIVAINPNSSYDFLLPNAGDGTFGPSINVENGAQTETDFNLDGKRDLIGIGPGKSVRVLLNQGAGIFAALDIPVSDTPSTATAADLDQDGDMDLVLTLSNTFDVRVLLDQGGFAFAAVDYPLTPYPKKIVIADFDGVKGPDLAVTGGNNKTLTMLLNQGTGIFAVGMPQDLPVVPDSVAAVDLDKDGKPDLVFTTNSDGNVYRLRNLGMGGFDVPEPIPAGNKIYAVAAADLDGNGWPDLVAGDHENQSMNLLLNDGTGAFGAPLLYEVSGYPTGLVTSDLNGDGLPDIALTNQTQNVLVMLATCMK